MKLQVTYVSKFQPKIIVKFTNHKDKYISTMIY